MWYIECLVHFSPKLIVFFNFSGVSDIAPNQLSVPETLSQIFDGSHFFRYKNCSKILEFSIFSKFPYLSVSAKLKSCGYFWNFGGVSILLLKGVFKIFNLVTSLTGLTARLSLTFRKTLNLFDRSLSVKKYILLH